MLESGTVGSAVEDFPVDPRPELKYVATGIKQVEGRLRAEAGRAGVTDAELGIKIGHRDADLFRGGCQVSLRFAAGRDAGGSVRRAGRFVPSAAFLARSDRNFLSVERVGAVAEQQGQPLHLGGDSGFERRQLAAGGFESSERAIEFEPARGTGVNALADVVGLGTLQRDLLFDSGELLAQCRRW